jgi:hypothetical protein
MAVTPQIAPYFPSFFAREPYISVAEFVNSPTGQDVSALVPGGSAALEADVLADCILQASSWADSVSEQVIAATVEVETGFFMSTQGVFAIPCSQTPIVQVNALSYGASDALITVPSLAGVQIGRKVVYVPTTSVQSLATVPFSGPLSTGGMQNRRQWAQLTYVAGFPNGFLTAVSASGASTLTFDSVIGINPGLTMVVNDPGATETVTVLSILGNVVTLTAPMKFGHPVGANVSTFPAGVKKAIILFTAALIGTRDTDAIVMNSISGNPAQFATGMPAEQKAMMSLGIQLLHQFARTQ